MRFPFVLEGPRTLELVDTPAPLFNRESKTDRTK